MRNADIGSFIDEIARISSPNAFNPYSDICACYDRPNANQIRSLNLQRALEACASADRFTLWIGRDLGYRGGRRTGIALVDDTTLNTYSKNIDSDLAIATVGPSINERTASVVGRALARITLPVFTWNVFPLHPFRRDDPFSNRPHTKEERRSTQFALRWLVDELQPDSIVAIGRDAQLALTEMEISHLPARHPSYGGQNEFLTAMEDIYNIDLRDHSEVSQMSFL